MSKLQVGLYTSYKLYAHDRFVNKTSLCFTRLRKVKCDKELPCNHCKRRGESDTCTYVHQVRLSSQATTAQQSSLSDHSLRDELVKLKARLEQVESRQDNVVATDEVTSKQEPTSLLSSAKDIWKPQGYLTCSSEGEGSVQRDKEGSPTSSQTVENRMASIEEWKTWSMYRRMGSNALLAKKDDLYNRRKQSLATKKDFGKVDNLLYLLPTKDEALQLIEDK